MTSPIVLSTLKPAGMMMGLETLFVIPASTDGSVSRLSIRVKLVAAILIYGNRKISMRYIGVKRPGLYKAKNINRFTFSFPVFVIMIRSECDGYQIKSVDLTILKCKVTLS